MMMIIRIGIWFSVRVTCLPKKTVRFVTVYSTAKNSISWHVSAVWQANISLYTFTCEDKKQQIVHISADYWQVTQIEYYASSEQLSPFLLVGLDERSRCKELSIKKRNYLSLIMSQWRHVSQQKNVTWSICWIVHVGGVSGWRHATNIRQRATLLIY
jgi:hypothetical protein